MSFLLQNVGLNHIPHGSFESYFLKTCIFEMKYTNFFLFFKGNSEMANFKKTELLFFGTLLVFGLILFYYQFALEESKTNLLSLIQRRNPKFMELGRVIISKNHCQISFNISIFVMKLAF